MIRWLLWLLGGLLLGGIVHLATRAAAAAHRDAGRLYAACRRSRRSTRVAPLPPPTPDDAVLPFMDPAFATAVCRYDLADGPLKLQRAGQPGLYVGVVLYPQRRRLLRDQRPRRRPARHRARSDDGAAARRAAGGRGSDRRRPADRGIADRRPA